MTPEDKVAASYNLIQHIKEATDACSVYNENVKAARSEMSNFDVTMDGQVLSILRTCLMFITLLTMSNLLLCHGMPDRLAQYISRPLGKFRYLECVLREYINN